MNTMMRRCGPMMWAVANRSARLIQLARMSDAGPKPVWSRKAKSQSTRVKSIVDYRTVQVRGGKGGDGCISLLRMSKNPFGGPDGGDGGNGGHVIFKATSNRNSLEHLTSILNAEHGEKGTNRDCHGRSASHTIIEVPIGTMFRSIDGRITADLDHADAMFVAARGGAGGRGNHYFATDVNQTPEVAEIGADGEHQSYTVEMRTIADIGLVGFPNAGKSTFLRAISRARPKVASYPFTTLQPHVGMVQYDDLQQVAVADIPGLIAGAHRNRGLGISFLRHIERCVCLLYVIDCSMPEAHHQLDVLRHEIEQYNELLLARPSAVVANKMDEPSARDNLVTLQEHVDHLKLPLFPISAKERSGIVPVLKHIRLLYDSCAAARNNEEE